jgi:hypothetical protein
MKANPPEEFAQFFRGHLKEARPVRSRGGDMEIVETIYKESGKGYYETALVSQHGEVLDIEWHRILDDALLYHFQLAEKSRMEDTLIKSWAGGPFPDSTVSEKKPKRKSNRKINLQGCNSCK